MNNSTHILTSQELGEIQIEKPWISLDIFSLDDEIQLHKICGKFPNILHQPPIKSMLQRKLSELSELTKNTPIQPSISIRQDRYIDGPFLFLPARIFARVK